MIPMPDTTTEVVVDLFADEPALCASGKRPRLNDDDPDVVRWEAESLEIEHVEAARWALIVDKMARQAHAQEMVRGYGPFGHVAPIEKTTQHAESGNAQIKTGT